MWLLYPHRELLEKVDSLEDGKGSLPEGFELDEMETFEGCRSTRPLTLPVVIEAESMFIVDARCAPCAPTTGRRPAKTR